MAKKKCCGSKTAVPGRFGLAGFVSGIIFSASKNYRTDLKNYEYECLEKSMPKSLLNSYSK
jgi:hypothetical protein